MTTYTLDRLPSVEIKKIWCHYRNDTRYVQIARIEDIPNEHLERVIFPGGRLVFQTFPHAWLEIYTGELCSALLSDRFLCDRLKMQLS